MAEKCKKYLFCTLTGNDSCSTDVSLYDPYITCKFVFISF